MWGIRRLRFATGVDDDLRPFYEAFQRRPRDRQGGPRGARVPRRRAPLPWEALSNAISEQLIEFERAVAIQRRLIARARRRAARDTGLRDAPTPAAVGGDRAGAARVAGPRAGARADAAQRVAAEVAAGRVDLLAADPLPGWRRLRSIPGVGPWTLEALALYGQGHHDRVPAGDLGYLKLVGRITTGNPKARVDEAAVREFFEPYGEWKGLAGEYLRLAGCARPAARSVLRQPAGVEPLAGQELVRHRLLGDLPPRDQALVEHPVGVALPLVEVLVAERPLVVGGEEDRQRRLHDRLLEPAVEPLVGLEQPVDPRLRVGLAAPRARARSPA